MALITRDTIKAALLERPFLVSQQTTERDVQAAYADIMACYVSRALPFYSEDSEEYAYDEEKYNAAVCALTFARLCYSNVAKVGYAVATARHDNTNAAQMIELRKTARAYRKIGISYLEAIRTLSGITDAVEFIPILGEEI